LRKIKKVLCNLVNIPLRIFSKIAITAIISNSKISKKSAISGKTRFYDSEINDYSYVGRNGLIINTKIGKFCSIADDCKIGCSSHPTQWGSTSSVFHKGKNILRKNFSNFEYTSNKRTVIGNDVWIGNNVLIKDGITIGDGAIIGMGSVVTKNVEPYSIVGGVPAKIIRYRFEEQDIQELLNIKWWELKENEISYISSEINNIKEFIKKVKEVKND